jgi:PAS domain S-box-containing protein
LLYQALAAGRFQDTVPTVSPIDGVARIHSWRGAADQPLVVSVALAQADYLAEWRGDMVFTALSSCVTILVIICLTILHHRQLRRAERAATALRLNEERFRDFADASSDWYWEQDESLRFTHISVANRPWSTFAPAASYGKTRRETTALGVSEEQWARHDADIAARRPLRDFRSQRIDADGRLHHLSVSGVPMFDAAGVFRGYRGTGRDITAEVEAVENPACRDRRDSGDDQRQGHREPLRADERASGTPLRHDAGARDRPHRRRAGRRRARPPHRPRSTSRW